MPVGVVCVWSTSLSPPVPVPTFSTPSPAQCLAPSSSGVSDLRSFRPALIPLYIHRDRDEQLEAQYPDLEWYTLPRTRDVTHTTPSQHNQASSAWARGWAAGTSTDWFLTIGWMQASCTIYAPRVGLVRFVLIVSIPSHRHYYLITIIRVAHIMYV
ncbi:hypothetical protein HD554DRAFT_2041945 [Boletus coccyginus]|nr:hypothetical protein HD554DRAFT_2041945 [Boletus coccyginus]